MLTASMPASQHPSARRVQLSAVKYGIYHGSMPTFRQMDMDEAMNKLPEEHRRTSTMLGPQDFRRAMTDVKPPSRGLPALESSQSMRPMQARFSSEEYSKRRRDWTDFLDHSPSRFGEFRCQPPTARNLNYSGYGVRLVQPPSSLSFRNNLTTEPNLDFHGQRPTPADIFRRYRDTAPQYSRSVTAQPWQPR